MGPTGQTGPKGNTGTTGSAGGQGPKGDTGGYPAHWIGETYGGGIVFYVYDNGQHGLIGATTDQSTSIRWYGGTNTNTRARADGVGAGKLNTAIIIANQGPVDGNPFAASVCNEYQGGGYGGWYLPSNSELNLLYDARYNMGGIPPYYYWSSKENNSTTAWFKSFDNGSWVSYDKSTTNAARAIRAF
jgi:hypothetical protein